MKCVQALESFKDAQSGRQPTIDTSLSTSRQKLYELNCKKLDAIIECMVLYGTQDIPLCGHNDGNSYEGTKQNKGNFKAISDYRAIGDATLQKHLASGAKNAQYTSADTQNEIIKLCRSLTLSKIGNEVKQNELYSIICDECTDGANKEQLSLSVRYMVND